jgi:hypothetical protein
VTSPELVVEIAGVVDWPAATEAVAIPIGANLAGPRSIARRRLAQAPAESSRSYVITTASSSSVARTRLARSGRLSPRKRGLCRETLESAIAIGQGAVVHGGVQQVRSLPRLEEQQQTRTCCFAAIERSGRGRETV